MDIYSEFLLERYKMDLVGLDTHTLSVSMFFGKTINELLRWIRAGTAVLVTNNDKLRFFFIKQTFQI